jgi:hypothetical protein
MITVTVLSSNYEPVGDGVPFQLVSVGDDPPKVISSAKTDAAGVITFPVDAASIGKVAIRLDVESLDQMGPTPDTMAAAGPVGV